MNQTLTPLISPEEISITIKRLAKEINQDYQNCPLTILGILKGSFIFIADLVREIDAPVDNIEFIQLSSYQENTVSAGKASLLLDVDTRRHWYRLSKSAKTYSIGLRGNEKIIKD